MNAKWFTRVGLCTLFATVSLAASAAPPKVAVTDLAYEERVSEYFRVVAATQKSSLRASGRESERESDFNYSRRSSGSVNAKSESSYYEAEGTYSYIDRGELRKFTADIKGGILQSGRFQLVQGKPFTDAKNTEKLYDIIGRIKKGMYPGADYVLFGTVSDIAFTQDTHALANTKSYSAILGLTLVANFSVINTRTLEVTSAFTAVGEGQNAKLVNSRDVEVSLNRPLVVREVAKTLGGNVAHLLKEQLAGITPERRSTEPVQRTNLPADEAPKILH